MANDQGRLAGMNAVVTGAGRGIGRAIAKAFAREGAAVALAARSGEELAALEDELTTAGGQVLTVLTDITQDDQVDELAVRTQRAWGRVDVLVNNAGLHVAGRFEDLSMEDWHRSADVNIHGTVRVTRAFLPGMLEQGSGRIINVASTAGKYGSLYQSPYNAAKHAVVGITRCLALEAADRGVRANAICPGFVDTDMFSGIGDRMALLLGVQPDEVADVLLRRVPIGRLIEPDEVAELAVYLASPAADGMTGQALTLAGGLILV